MAEEKEASEEFCCYIGNETRNDLEKIRLRIKNYMEMDNVSVLAGAGTSFHLGAPIIRTIPEEINEKLIGDEEVKEFYISKMADLEKTFDNISLEKFLNYLQAERFIEAFKGKEIESHNKLIRKIQSELFTLCNTEITTIPDEYSDDEQLKENKYFYHEKMLKKLLQRPVNLKRLNLFTLNYDLAFEYTFDNSGIHYINGFSGYQNRCFHPETYDYDIYYPGQTTSGKVYRAEQVIRYYKLHGSLSWIFSEPRIGNLYGITEIPVGKEKPPNELVIYPCATKKSYTLDLPYSELFRLFASSIKQNQSVLFCIGYSFNDGHINDIIYQALSIPSFTLFIVDFKSTENDEIKKLKALDDPRIIIIEGECAKFTYFVKEVMPDLYEEKDEIKIAKTMNDLFVNKEEKKEDM